MYQNPNERLKFDARNYYLKQPLKAPYTETANVACIGSSPELISESELESGYCID